MVVRMYNNGYRPTPAEYRQMRKKGQLANSRIVKAEKQFIQEWGAKYVPQELAGYWTSKNRWFSDTQAISTSMKQFETRQDYLDYMARVNRVANAPTLKRFAQAEHTNTVKAIMQTMGTTDQNVKAYLDTMIGSMNAADIGAFWDLFLEESANMGMDYDSDEALISLISELFGEDLKSIIERSAEEAKTANIQRLFDRI